MHDHAHGRKAIETMIRSQDLGGLLRLAETFHGHLCPFVSLGVKAGQYAMAILDRPNTGMEEIVAIVECNNCFTDGIQVITGCTFGNNALIFKDLGKTAVTVARREDGQAVRLLVRPDYREQMFARYPNTEPLFQKVVVERQGTHEDWHRFDHMWEAIARRELKTPLEEQFLIKSLTITMPEYARIFESKTCSICGEQVMAPRAVGPAEKPLCLECAASQYYMLTGQGIASSHPGKVMTEPEMHFLEHLQELRQRLIFSLIALFIGMALAWTFALSALTVIQRPLAQPSLMKRLQYDLVSRLQKKFPQFAEQIHLEPPDLNVPERKLNYMAPLEPFFVQMKLSLIMGLILALPIILYQTWQFIAPGLYTHEKKYVYLFIPVGTLAFILGDLFFLYIVWPLIVAFSLGYESATLFPLLNLTQYVNFCLRLLLLFGLIFELPLILLILARLGVVKLEFLVGQRRLALLLSLVVAAFHADVVTMAMVALPLYGMYEISILVIRLLGGAKSKQAETSPETPLPPATV